MSAVTSEEKMANPYEAWGELFVSDVIAQPGRHKVEAEGELHKRLSLFASYCMENATTAGDALLVNDLIDAARLVRLDKEAAIAKALADRPDLPGVPDGWLSFLDPLEAKASGEADVARVFGLEHPIVDVTPDEILSLRPQIEAAIEAKVAEERERCAKVIDERVVEHRGLAASLKDAHIAELNNDIADVLDDVADAIRSSHLEKQP